MKLYKFTAYAASRTFSKLRRNEFVMSVVVQTTRKPQVGIFPPPSSPSNLWVFICDKEAREANEEQQL